MPAGLPEHTLAPYRTAIRLGADYIEPDLVSTKNGHLVARHEPNITNTTDLAQRPAFADRKRTAIVDGVAEDGWFASDFTLEELRTLRAKQPMADRPQRFNGRYRVPTFEQVIDLAQRQAVKQRRRIGVIPEVKHSTYNRRSACRSSGASSPYSRRSAGTPPGRPCGSSPSSRRT